MAATSALLLQVSGSLYSVFVDESVLLLESGTDQLLLETGDSLVLEN